MLSNDYSIQTRDLRDSWAKKINDLPVELHGAVPNQSSIRSAAIIHNVVSDDQAIPTGANDILLTEQRIVLYLDGVDIPARQDFCTLNKKPRNSPVEDHALTFRAAVCDGFRCNLPFLLAEKEVGTSQ